MKKVLFLFAAAFLLSSVGYSQDTSKTKSSMSKSMHMKDCYMMKNGKMVMEKNGSATDMTQDVTLSNGTIVMKDGTVKTKDGKTMMLKDGQCVYTDGKVKTMSSTKKSTTTSSSKKPTP